ncbi:hypothetical protein NRS6194_04174 [Bacillus subtilis]|nr:hypothetical protein NRS6194_04174 [Bacillus subtilis]
MLFAPARVEHKQRGEHDERRDDPQRSEQPELVDIHAVVQPDACQHQHDARDGGHAAEDEPELLELGLVSAMCNGLHGVPGRRIMRRIWQARPRWPGRIR